MLINILEKALSQKCHTHKWVSIVEIKNPQQFRKINQELLRIFISNNKKSFRYLSVFNL